MEEKKYEYGFRSVFCKDQEVVDHVINDEIYKLNKPEDVISINVTPYIDPKITEGFVVPACFYLSYVYRYEILPTYQPKEETHLNVSDKLNMEQQFGEEY